MSSEQAITATGTPSLRDAVPDGGWQRLHPLTPLLRGGRVFGVVAALVTREVVQGVGAGRAVAVILVVTLAGLGYGYLSWRATRWGIVGGDLRLDTGVLVRRSRRVPLARLQAVDVVRGLVARTLGLAELRLEVVGHGKTEAPFAYLSDDEAQALRARLLALSRGAETGEVPTAPEAPRPETPLAKVPTGALVESLLRSVPTAVAVGLAVLTVVLLAVDPRLAAASGATLLPAIAAAGATAVRRLLTEYGFTVSSVDQGLLLRHGLLETRTQTIPQGRVQAVRVVAPRLWRSRDWVRVEVDVAGYGNDESAGTHALLPVAPRALAVRVLAEVLPGVDVQQRDWRGVPGQARWLAPWQYRRLAVDLDATAVYTRSGWLTEVIDVVMVAKLQSQRLTQGPLQRRLGLASVHPDTAGRRLSTTARLRDAHEARRLLDALGAASRARATTSDPAVPSE